MMLQKEKCMVNNELENGASSSLFYHVDFSNQIIYTNGDKFPHYLRPT